MVWFAEIWFANDCTTKLLHIFCKCKWCCIRLRSIRATYFFLDVSECFIDRFGLDFRSAPLWRKLDSGWCCESGCINSASGWTSPNIRLTSALFSSMKLLMLLLKRKSSVDVTKQQFILCYFLYLFSILNWLPWSMTCSSMSPCCMNMCSSSSLRSNVFCPLKWPYCFV